MVDTLVDNDCQWVRSICKSSPVESDLFKAANLGILDCKSVSSPRHKCRRVVRLFHGTDANSAMKIVIGGFDIKCAGDGRFGRGLYFTDSPEKAIRYGTTILVVDVDLGMCKR